MVQRLLARPFLPPLHRYDPNVVQTVLGTVPGQISRHLLANGSTTKYFARMRAPAAIVPEQGTPGRVSIHLRFSRRARLLGRRYHPRDAQLGVVSPYVALHQCGGPRALRSPDAASAGGPAPETVRKQRGTGPVVCGPLLAVASASVPFATVRGWFVGVRAVLIILCSFPCGSPP